MKSMKMEYITPQQMNILLEKVEQKYTIQYGSPNTKNTNNFKYACYIDDKYTRMELTCMTEQGKVVHYVCYKDDRDAVPSMSGVNAWKTFCQYVKVPIYITADDAKNDPEYVKSFFSASPLIDFNPAYDKTRQEAWGYDLNSAYSSAMLSMWIDTSNCPEQKFIEVGKEVGFGYKDVNGKMILCLLREGYSNYVFPITAVPEGVKKFIKVWYDRKKKAKNAEEKNKAKGMLNYLVGFLQRRNPYLRALIVCLCNEKIERLIDKDTLFWNTDSIVSRVRRPDIEAELGDDIGQWKLEHSGVVAYDGNTYQWNDDKPVWRGVPKNLIPADYDLLNSSMDEIQAPSWKYNFDTNRMEETVYGNL